MMKRLLCIRFPSWPIQRLVAAQPELSGRVIVLHASDARRGECVVACSRAAYRQGIRPGMSLAEAMSLQDAAMASEAALVTARRARETGGATIPHCPAPATAADSLRGGAHDHLLSDGGDELGGRAAACGRFSAPDRPSSNRQAPHIADHDFQADMETLEELAQWCECFSPVVGFEHLSVAREECSVKRSSRGMAARITSRSGEKNVAGHGNLAGHGGSARGSC